MKKFVLWHPFCSYRGLREENGIVNRKKTAVTGFLLAVCLAIFIVCMGCPKGDGKVKYKSVRIEAKYDEATGLIVGNGLVFEITENIDKQTMRVFMVAEEHGSDIVVPNEVSFEEEVYQVTAIGEYAFQDCEGINSIEVSPGITEVQEGGFYGCPDLVKVELPDTITSMDANAFGYCAALTEIQLPAKLEKLGEQAFAECSSLERISLPGTINNMGNSVFYDCEALKEVVFEEGIGRISKEAFTNCYSLEKVELPESLVSIEDEAFWSCESLQELTLPKNVSHLGDRCFYTSGLTSLRVESGALVPGEETFSFADELQKVIVPQSLLGDYEKMLEGRDVEVEALSE